MLFSFKDVMWQRPKKDGPMDHAQIQLTSFGGFLPLKYLIRGYVSHLTGDVHHVADPGMQAHCWFPKLYMGQRPGIRDLKEVMNHC